MPFITNSDKDRAEMLKFIGAESFESLLRSIPDNLRLKKELDLEAPMSELEILRRIKELKNSIHPDMTNFAGGGIYEHYIPKAVSAVLSDPAFYTSYTPYQAEVSQGNLQAIYEFQTLICRLTGMDVANASMYDGATATVEAIFMAINISKKKKVLIPENMNPDYIKVIKTYMKSFDAEIIFIKADNGIIDLEDLKANCDDGLAAFVLCQPNYYGCLEQVDDISEIVHTTKKGMLITVAYPMSLAILKEPASYGTDICVGEAQCFGNSLNYGGPLLGFMAVKDKYKRKMPARVVGMTVDKDGKRGFVLTMQTREQHIRRDKATSNICTAQALNALAATVYLSLMGKEGLYEAAYQSMQKAHYLAEKICMLDGFTLMYDRQFFNEFAIRTEKPAAEIIEKCAEQGIMAGIEIEGGILTAVTEKRTKEEMDRFVEILKTI